jgi:hypothetical protein
MKSLTDFQQRLLDEHKELFEKFIVLGSFINSDKFSYISDAQQELLQEQWTIMDEYRAVLAARIDDLNLHG